MQALCSTYLEAPALQQQGTHVISTDEKTGMQATERKYPTLPTRPGLDERLEFEYIRHGTLCLIPSFNVATGQIDVATISPTRSEEDFAGHVEATVATDPAARWIFVSDCLNTHVSESLVHLVAKHCNVTQDLGEKGKSGILKSMATRKEFLADRSHAISFQLGGAIKSSSSRRSNPPRPRQCDEGGSGRASPPRGSIAVSSTPTSTSTGPDWRSLPLLVAR